MIQMCAKIMDLYYAICQRAKLTTIKSYGGQKLGVSLYMTCFHEHSN